MRLTLEEVRVALDAVFFTQTGRGHFQEEMAEDVRSGIIPQGRRRHLAMLCEERAEIYRIRDKYLMAAPGLVPVYAARVVDLRTLAERLVQHGGE